MKKETLLEKGNSARGLTLGENHGRRGTRDDQGAPELLLQGPRKDQRETKPLTRLYSSWDSLNGPGRALRSSAAPYARSTTVWAVLAPTCSSPLGAAAGTPCTAALELEPSESRFGHLMCCAGLVGLRARRHGRGCWYFGAHASPALEQVLLGGPGQAQGAGWHSREQGDGALSSKNRHRQRCAESRPTRGTWSREMAIRDCSDQAGDM